jgi:hypothetical protein
MSLTNVGVIDLVALTPDKSRVVLLVTDSGEITAENEREVALQKKLLGYLNFVASGQFVKAYPEHADRGVGVIVVCETPPTDGMTKVKGIQDHNRPDTFLPVEVTTPKGFQAIFRGFKPPTKPWWRIW